MSKVLFTYEDYERISEDQDCELIEGDIVMTPSPRPKHQRVVAKIAAVIHRALADTPSQGSVFVELDVEFPKHTVLRPDVLFVSESNREIVGEERLVGSPDLVVEVLSPATVRKDRETKRRIYQQYGVKEYWLVSPEAESVHVVDVAAGTEALFGLGDTLHSQVLRADLTVADIFG